MPIPRTLVLALVVARFSSPCAVAQEPAVAAAPAADEFEAAVADYKEAIRTLESLRAEYQNADTAARDAINQKLQDLVAQTKVKVDRMTDAALASYQAAPNANPEVANLLVAMAQHLAMGQEPPGATGGDYSGGDQPYQALPIIKALLAGEHPEPKLYAWGGACAVWVHDYDLAEALLTKAQESGVFEGLPRFQARDTKANVVYMMKARDYLTTLDERRGWWAEEQKIRQAEEAADDLPRVKFTTTKGDVVIELFENEAPIATANMISLVKEGYYDGIVFHRVLPHFMAQGGDPTGTGSGGPGYTITSEAAKPDARKHFRGTMSMANTGRPNSGGSQFFMCFVPTDFLNGRHTAFGRVIEGDEVMGKLQRIDPAPEVRGPRPQPDKIVKAEVLRDRGHAYEFEKLPEQ